MLNWLCRSAPPLLSLPSPVTPARPHLLLLCKFRAVQTKSFMLTVSVGPDRKAICSLRHNHVDGYRHLVLFMCLSEMQRHIVFLSIHVYKLTDCGVLSSNVYAFLAKLLLMCGPLWTYRVSG